MKQYKSMITGEEIRKLRVAAHFIGDLARDPRQTPERSAEMIDVSNTLYLLAKKITGEELH